MSAESITDIPSAMHDSYEAVTLLQRIEDVLVQSLQAVLRFGKKAIENPMTLNCPTYLFAQFRFFLGTLSARHEYERFWHLTKFLLDGQHESHYQ